MHRNKSVDVHQFAMVPRSEIPRSSFRIQTSHKTTFDGGWLVPCYVDEVLPGDSFHLRMTAFCRMATPIFPLMDNLYFETFFFFVPTRLVWSNFKKFMGEQVNPGDSISYLVPTVTSPAGGFLANSIYDYMGIPPEGQIPVGNTLTVNALPLRAYNLIYNEWFRDENLINSVSVPLGDGPDNPTTFTLLRRGKRHDYFTSALPFLQKGTAVPVPLGATAPVISSGTGIPTFKTSATGTYTGNTLSYLVGSGSWDIGGIGNSTVTEAAKWDATNLVADLSAATAATINQIRQAFQIQKLLERDARGGTRYTEIVRSHFGVVSPDARLQRPEYLGGGSEAINITPVAQTAPGTSVSNTPKGTLSAFATALASGHGFHQSFTEHGYIIGLVNVRADLSYQQGLRKMWSRSTRYDFYFPVFAALGEQAILNKEIYATGDAADNNVFGYQERWAEYRYHPAYITGYFRSTTGTPLDAWHLAQRFTALPTLNSTFINDTPPLDRVIAVGAGANGAQLYMDAFFDIKAARPMPMYSVPGMIDHF